MTVFACLPCYNEEHSLPRLLERFAELAGTLDTELRLIAVDDGSQDGTRRVLENHTGEPPVELVIHERNQGLGRALASGFRAALDRADGDDDVVIWLDADDTHDPSHIPEMLARVAQGADIVIASRFVSGGEEVGVPGFRRLLSRGARYLFAMTLPIGGVRDYTCGFRAYRVGLLRRAREVYGDELIEARGFACTDEVLLKLSALTERIEEIPFVVRYDRKHGASAMPLLPTILATLQLVWHGRSIRRQAVRRLRDLERE